MNSVRFYCGKDSISLGDLEEKAVIEYFKNQRKREDTGNSPRGIDCDKLKKKSHGMINDIVSGSKFHAREVW